jgi:hypothetical protein
MWSNRSTCWSVPSPHSSAIPGDKRLTLLPVPRQVNANGNVVRSEILGAIKMKCYLSGMPELRLGLNDKVMFESTGRSESIMRHSLRVCDCCR